MYTAADHCHSALTPGVSVENDADHVTAPMSSGKPPSGTGKARPDTNARPERPLGTTVVKRLLAASKLVVASLTDGSNVILVSATGRL